MCTYVHYGIMRTIYALKSHKGTLQMSKINRGKKKMVHEAIVFLPLVSTLIVILVRIF
jgi:hypothetical protein